MWLWVNPVAHKNRCRTVTNDRWGGHVPRGGERLGRRDLDDHARRSVNAGPNHAVVGRHVAALDTMGDLGPSPDRARRLGETRSAEHPSTDDPHAYRRDPSKEPPAADAPVSVPLHAHHTSLPPLSLAQHRKRSPYLPLTGLRPTAKAGAAKEPDTYKHHTSIVGESL